MSGRRGQRLYDWWSRHGGLLGRLYDAVFLGGQARLRARSVAALDLSPGDTVLELGCGDGRSLHRLRTRVGPEGWVVALDYSAGMVRRARERVREARRVLRPGGRMTVLDARPFGEPWTPLNRLVVPVSRWATDWNPEADVPGAMAAAFGGVDLETHVWGTVFVASARAGNASGR
jgi:phosphatidylethanolamine/phosphatidyl-N-methylethanolamine N-methyltransferase